LQTRRRALRASYGRKTPDAIHAATAIRSRASLFVANDAVFKGVQESPA
jgi:predicted nucleic acid-binding protein